MRSKRRFVARSAMLLTLAPLLALPSFSCGEADPKPSASAPQPASTPPAVAPRSILVSSWPSDGTEALPRSEWLQLRFSEPPSGELVESFRLLCDETRVDFDAHATRPTFWILNPRGALPADARCFFGWREAGISRRIVFATAGRGRAATVEYDRETPGLSPPFPDDVFLRADADTPTGLAFGFDSLGSLESPRPLHAFVGWLAQDLANLDGFSPLGHLQIALSDAIDPASLPLSPAESIHPASALQLIDVDPRSPSFGERVAYDATRRQDPGPDGRLQHSVLLHPLLPLRRGGRYALIATRSLRASPERPFQPSTFMQRVLGEPREDDSEPVVRVRRRVRSALWVAERRLSPPIPRDDMALVVRFTVGSLEGIEEDLAHVRRQLGVRPLPRYAIEEVVPSADAGDPVEAIVYGTWQVPRWTREGRFERGPGDKPVISAHDEIGFTLALARDRSLDGSPVVMYQHGNPGSARDEVPSEARRGLAAAGYSVIGFTDVFNRDRVTDAAEGEAALFAQWTRMLAALQKARRVSEYWLQTHAEQLAFLRLIDALAELDVLPAGRPDGVPELDGDAPIRFLGVSEGANHAPAFLTFAPEVAAAALVAGGAPIAGAWTHQIEGSLGQPLARLALGGHGRDLWLALALLQAALDRQDPVNIARRWSRDPIEVSGTTRKASVLLTAGIYDRRVPNRTTDALAWVLGPLPMLSPVTRAVPFLHARRGPIRHNLTSFATGAYHQIVPFGLAGAPGEPDCDPARLGDWLARSGHFCAQLAPSAIAERIAFFDSVGEARGGEIRAIDRELETEDEL